MSRRLSRSRLTAVLLTVALLVPVLGASPACAHSARKGARGCCCSHESVPGPALDRSMDCCRVDRVPAPTPVQATLSGPGDSISSELPAPEADGLEPFGHPGGILFQAETSRSESPPDPIFLLNSVFRM